MFYCFLFEVSRASKSGINFFTTGFHFCYLRESFYYQVHIRSKLFPDLFETGIFCGLRSECSQTVAIGVYVSMMSIISTYS
jgi:hypothetical protein